MGFRCGFWLEDLRGRVTSTSTTGKEKQETQDKRAEEKERTSLIIQDHTRSHFTCEL